MYLSFNNLAVRFEPVREPDREVLKAREIEFRKWRD